MYHGLRGRALPLQNGLRKRSKAVHFYTDPLLIVTVRRENSSHRWCRSTTTSSYGDVSRDVSSPKASLQPLEPPSMNWLPELAHAQPEPSGHQRRAPHSRSSESASYQFSPLSFGGAALQAACPMPLPLPCHPKNPSQSPERAVLIDFA